MTHNTDITPTKVQQDSKLGDIPMAWKVVPFGDISDKKTKWSITGGPFGSDLKSEHYTDRGVRVIQLQNIGDGTFNQEYKIYTSEEKADQLIACNIFPGEIILSKMGDPVARACFIPNGEDRYLMGSDGIRLVVNKDKFDSKFVLEYINYSIFRNLAIRHSTGSTRSRIGLTDLKKLPFISPPLPEQQKIAQILSAWDKAIAKQEALLVQKQELKKGLMQQLLNGKKRLAGFTHEWKKIEFEKIALRSKGKFDCRKEKISEKCIELEHIEQGTGQINSWIDSSNQRSIKNVFSKGQVLFGKLRPYLRKFWLASFCGVCSSEIWVLNPIKNTCVSNYLFYLVQTNKFIQIANATSGSKMPRADWSYVSTIPFHIPEIKEQQKIAEVLTAADNEIIALQQQLQQLKMQKEGLMQQLLTGKIRVKN